MSPNIKRTLRMMFRNVASRHRNKEFLSKILSKYEDKMFVLITETLKDGRERGFHIYQDQGVVGHTFPQVGSEVGLELKLKELPFSSTNFALISFHTHNGGDEKPSLTDIQTALSLGEDYLCIGCTKNNKPHITCWKIKCEKVL